MTADAFAGFWKLQGHRVIKTKSCYWYDAQPLSFLSMPYHRFVTPSREELARVMLHGAVVRYPAFSDELQATGGMYICASRGYDFPNLNSKARNQTRRGLENCSIERVEFDYLAEHGVSLNEDTFVRQGRSVRSVSPERWRKYCEAASRNADFEAWAAFSGGVMISFAVTALVEDCFNILHQSSATKSLAQYPNNALIFSLTKRKLEDSRVGFVSYGLRSLDKADTLEHFKFGMGFSLRPSRDCIVLNPLLGGFLRIGGGQLIERMARARPASDLWRKASRVLEITALSPHRDCQIRTA